VGRRPSEIKLSGTDLWRSSRAVDLRQERACRIERGQELDHAAAAGRARLDFFFKRMRNALVPDSLFDPARSGWPARGRWDPAPGHQITAPIKGATRKAPSKSTTWDFFMSAFIRLGSSTSNVILQQLL